MIMRYSRDDLLAARFNYTAVPREARKAIFSNKQRGYSPTPAVTSDVSGTRPTDQQRIILTTRGGDYVTLSLTVGPINARSIGNKVAYI